MKSIVSDFKLMGSLLGLCLVLAMSSSVQASSLATIELEFKSPRDVAASTTDIYTQVYTGLNVVGVGQKMYIAGEPSHGAVVGGYQWALTVNPSPTAALSATTGQEITFTPDKLGIYQIRLTPLDSNLQPTTSVLQTIYVQKYEGVGVMSTNGSISASGNQCGRWCHSDSGAQEPRLAVLEDWKETHHATKMQRHLNGDLGTNFPSRCISCHSVGWDAAAAAVQSGFDDVAKDLNYDLEQVPALVVDAATNNKDNFDVLPAALRAKASIQCESCHGPGSGHPLQVSQGDPQAGIGGVDLGVGQCAQCHDSGTHHIFPYQWDISGHGKAAEIEGGHVVESAGCLKCHSGEGFIDVRVLGKTAAVQPNFKYHGVTCSTCHDPHGSSNPHQLRLSGQFTFDSGQVAANPGMGGLCMNCHNSRMVNAENSATTSFRGAHYAPQADMLMGINGAAFGLTFNKNSAPYQCGG